MSMQKINNTKNKKKISFDKSNDTITDLYLIRGWLLGNMLIVVGGVFLSDYKVINLQCI